MVHMYIHNAFASIISKVYGAVRYDGLAIRTRSYMESSRMDGMDI